MPPDGSQTAPFARPPRLPEQARWHAMPLDRRGAGPSSAARVAWLVEREIAAEGWPEGRVFASLDDISRRFAIGRYVTHEAVRILEARGACELKRGPGGGLVVTCPQLA